MINHEYMPLNEVALRILNATDKLMATQGVQHLSMHKIARQADVSVGTLYLYFKDKEALLNCLVTHLFEQFHRHLAQHYDANLPLFEQYRSLWHGTWQFLEEHPNVLLNLHQYESLPNYAKLLANAMRSDELVCNQFIRLGQQQGVLVDLEQELLFSLTLRNVWEVMWLRTVLDKEYSLAVREEMIRRTWKSITY